MVLGSYAEDALVIICTDFFGAVVSNTLFKERGDVIRFGGGYRCPDDLIID